MIKPISGNVRAYRKKHAMKRESIEPAPPSPTIRHRCGMPARRMHRIDPANLEKAFGL